MDRSRRGIALAALLLVTGVAAVAAVSATPERPGAAPASPDPAAPVDPARAVAVAPTQVANGTPRRLGVGPGERVSDAGEPTARLGPAVSVGDGELRVRLDRYRARQLLADAATERERQAAVRQVLNETEAAVERLRARETAAVRAYHAGEIDRAELFRRIAAVHLAAAEHRRALAELQDRADDVIPRSPLDDRLLRLDLALEAFQSPVRERIAGGVSGVDARRVQVTATERGVVLEAVVDDLYVRDAVRVDRYAGGDGELIQLPAVDLAALYPYAFGVSSGSSIDAAGDRLFRVVVSHPQGQVRSHLNRDTETVYREVQRLRLDRLPTEPVRNASYRGVRVTVERVDGQDPTLVRLVDEETGEPVEAMAVLDNETVGPTVGGERWFVLGAHSTRLTLRTDRGPINVTITPQAGSGRLRASVTGDRTAGVSGRPGPALGGLAGVA